MRVKNRMRRLSYTATTAAGAHVQHAAAEVEHPFSTASCAIAPPDPLGRLVMTPQPSPSAQPAAIVLARTAEPLDGSARRLLMRGLAVVGLAGIALVHLVELPDTWRETVGLGVLFLLLVVAAASVAAGLVHTDTARLWQVTAVVAAAPIGGFVLTRSVAVPFDRGDVGNWLEPLGLVALFIEVSVLALCAHTLRALIAAKATADERS